MATLNELGRNSASITYGPYSNGQDLFPTLQAVDTWMRNDTWQGYATASGTTLTGVGTIWTTQARPGDYIMVAGQQRIVAASGVASDTSITVTVAFSPAITVPSAVVAINSVQPSITGTLQNVVRGTTSGVVSCTNGSTTITGVNTYFLSDLTNLTTTVAVAGTIAIDTSGNITGSGTSFSTGAGTYPAAGTANGLYPGDSIAVTVVAAGSMTGQVYYFTIATVTNDTTATVTVAPTTAIPALSTLVKATNASGGSGIGRYVNINGRIRQVTAVSSNNSITVNAAMDFTDSNMKLKVYPRGSLANASTYQGSGTFNGGTFTSTGTTALAIASVTGVVVPGAVIWGPSGTFTAGTTIVNQVSSTATVTSQSATGTIGQNVLTVAAITSIAVGQLVSGTTASVAGIPAGTYVTGVTGTSVYLSQNLQAGWTSATVYFSTPGGAGNYTTNAVTTFSTVASCLVSGITASSANFFWDLGYTYTNSTTNTVYMIQSSALDNIWIADEVRTLNFTSLIGGPLAALNGFTTDYAGYSGVAIGVIRQQLFNTPFKKEDSYINGNGTSFLNDLRIGDDLIIDGTHVTVSNIISNTQFKITFDMTHSTPSSTVYKKLKLHGYVLEGTREGGPTATPGKWSQLTTMVATAGAAQSLPVGTTVIPLTAQSTVTGVNQLVKISGAGGPPLALSGQINTVSASTTVTGSGTKFTTELHVGAEIVIAGQYFYVATISTDISMTVNASMSVTGPTPYYRTVPLYTYITAGTTSITLATPTKNTLYSVGVNPPTVAFPATGGDFIEYVYSAPNYYAESSTTTVLNQSYDRKYVAFRYWPFFASSNSTPDNPTATAIANLISGSGNKSSVYGAYATPVYERWVAGYAGTHGVGVNLADLSGGTMVMGVQAATSFTITQPIAGSIALGMAIQGTGSTITTIATNVSFGTAANSMTVTTGTLSASSIVAVSLDGVYDITSMTHVTGGYIYMFATKRYAIFQGKTFSNIQSQWVGCIEFERAQPEDSGTGSGASGVVFGGSIIETTGTAQMALGNTAGTAYGFSQTIRYLPGIAPWPCFAYVNGNRFPTGSAQIPTLPVLQTYPIHGGVLSTPRVRNSSGDLVGFNAHVYSACTITTGRWGHVVEFMGSGAYASPGQPASFGIIAQVGGQYSFSTGAGAGPINSVPQIHMGQIIPVFTNVYNSKRFMFSPVVVLGPAYDPDIRGRMYGLKVIPSALGALMDTVSITVNTTTPSAFNPDYFYNTSGAATDHWVLTTPPSPGLVPGQTVVTTYRFTTTQNSAQIQQSWRSLEDSSQQSTATGIGSFVNNFRFAIPA